MKNIHELLARLDGQFVSGSDAGEITELVYDSCKLTPGCAFVALSGASFDGHDFCKEAAEKLAFDICSGQGYEESKQFILDVYDRFKAASPKGDQS